MSDRLHVLLQTQGAYPFVKGGGVSTWAEMLCNGLAGEIDFHIYSVVGSPHLDLQYELPGNITDITKVPLWGAELPMAYYEPDRSFSSMVLEQELTTEGVIENIFFPLFEEFLTCLFHPVESSPRDIGLLFYRMWKFFQEFSYKKALQNERIWSCFDRKVKEYYRSNDLNRQIESFNLLEQTFGLRWLYHFLMPLDVPVPKVDVSHAASSGLPALPSIIGKLEYGTPYIVTDHGVWIRERIKNLNEDKELGFHSKRLLTNLSIIICKTAYYYADLVTPVTSIHRSWEEEFSAEAEQIKPVVNGVDIDKFRPCSVPAEEQYVRPTVVGLANLFPLKDIKTMIRTCKAVRKEIPEVQFLLYGDTTVDESYAADCRRLVEQLGLENHFFIKGFHDNPVEVYNKADLSILTSISEGAPYTVLESMSCACPVVATDVGGVREVLEDCGIIPEPRSVEGLAEGVVKLLRDDELRELLGKKSRKKVIEQFGSAGTISKYLENYHSVRRMEGIPDDRQKMNMLSYA
ncbi:GT4 family glycosyltransferase PelF [Fodinibius sediminis]|uniref:Glycosyltransferase involved in cell wall bisynthesis n=1 Tax=Fodinibius sediminis TaxID=1214077 RepID=A0A521CLN6_9BACT|nr:GT4 family glycosyltransferase PelF [Fodinibius sediminis]SMO60363.1 Glycosyltransferase involved in cell wall bisynthesis [Fodinibius sediminis]